MMRLLQFVVDVLFAAVGGCGGVVLFVLAGIGGLMDVVVLVVVVVG